MSLSEIVIEGTLKPDGTLELDRKPELAPGRVTVVLRQDARSTSLPQDGWWPYLQRVRSEREETNYQFMNETEMESHLLWLRDEEEHVERIHREMDQALCRLEKP